MPSARHRQRSQRGSGTSSARTGGSSARTGASSARTGASSVDRRAQSVDYELAKLIVTEAEAQWERARNGGKPMPLTLVLQTHKEVLRSRGDYPVRDDHSVHQVGRRRLLKDVALQTRKFFSRHVECVAGRKPLGTRSC